MMEQLLAEDTNNIFFKHRIAWLIMDSKDPVSASQLDRAFKLSREACGSGTPETPPDFLRTLAHIYHVKNEGRKAVQTAVQAVKAAQAKEQPALARTILEEAKTYKAAMTP
jgi:lipopolysaccharide biosynthesis regulator YciM